MKAAEGIRLEPPGCDEMFFTHAVLAQLGLPRSRTEDRRFERTNGGASLLIEAGEIWNGRQWLKQAIPYGPKPRIMLGDVSTRALRSGDQVVSLFDSVTEYVQHLGFTTQGGARGPLTMFQNQVKAMVACRMTVGVAYGNRAAQFDGRPFEGFESWLDDRGKQVPLWPATLRLSDQFWKSLQAHAVPLDMRAIRGLAGSALALDLYTWLAYRLHQLKKPLPLQWSHLRAQFGQEYKEEREFKREVLRLLPQVREAYPEANVGEMEGGRGLELRSSRPPISPRLIAVWARWKRPSEKRPAVPVQQPPQLLPAVPEPQQPVQLDVIEVKASEVKSESRKPVYLRVPYGQKDWAKSLGARWDGALKQWYVPSGLPVEPFSRWLQQ